MPFIGFNFPSHTHDVVPFLLKLISKGLSETVTVSETLEYNKFQVREPAEEIIVSEDLGLQVFKQTELTETVTISESLTRISTKIRSLIDTIGVSEALAKIKTSIRALANTISVSESVVGQKIVPRTLAETVTVSEALVRILSKVRSLAESIAVVPPSYYDTFPSTYTLTTDGQISGDGKWRMPYHGQNPQNGLDLGQAGVRVPSGGMFTNVMYEYPYNITNTGSSTSATLVLNESTYYQNFDVTLYIRTISQKKSSPNPWESAWFMFHFNEAQGTNFHHYYVALKTTGLEFGRKDRSDMVDAQCFLFTNSDAHTLGTWYKLRVRAIANHFTIWVDDVQKVDITDDGSLTDFQGPIPAPSIYQYSGLFGFYNEDAEVEFSPLQLAPIEVARQSIKTRTLAQTITSSEALARVLSKVRAIANTVTVSELLELGGRLTKSVSETITVSEALAMVRSKARAIANTVTSSEALTIDMRVKGRTQTDTVTISEALTKIISKNRTISEIITVLESLVLGKYKQKNLSETITVSEALTRVLLKIRALADTIVSSEVLSKILTPLGQLTLSEIITVGGTPTRSMIESRALTQTVILSDTVAFPKTVVKTLAQTITISDQVLKGIALDIALAETIHVVEAITRRNIQARDFDETITVTDEASKIKSYSPEDTGGAGGVKLQRWDFDLNDAGVYHVTKKNVIGQSKTGGNK